MPQRLPDTSFTLNLLRIAGIVGSLFAISSESGELRAP